MVVECRIADVWRVWQDPTHGQGNWPLDTIATLLPGFAQHRHRGLGYGRIVGLVRRASRSRCNETFPTRIVGARKRAEVMRCPAQPVGAVIAHLASRVAAHLVGSDRVHPPCEPRGIASRAKAMCEGWYARGEDISIRPAGLVCRCPSSQKRHA